MPSVQTCIIVVGPENSIEMNVNVLNRRLTSCIIRVCFKKLFGNSYLVLSEKIIVDIENIENIEKK